MFVFEYLFAHEEKCTFGPLLLIDYPILSISFSWFNFIIYVVCSILISTSIN